VGRGHKKHEIDNINDLLSRLSQEKQFNRKVALHAELRDLQKIVMTLAA